MYIMHEAFEDEGVDIRSRFLFIDTENDVFITECSGWKVPKWVPRYPDNGHNKRYIGKESKHTIFNITTETLSMMSDVKRFRDNTNWVGIKIRG